MCFLHLAEFVDQLSNIIYSSYKIDQTLTGHVIATETSVGSSLQCMQYCANMANGQCKSFNYKTSTGKCQLNSESGQQVIEDMTNKTNYNHFYMSQSDPIMLP